MARFNAVQNTMTENLAGGQAYQQSAAFELVSILLTSFATDQYYRGFKDQALRIDYLIGVCDKEFAAKAIIYARTKFGMRSVTHAAASIIARHISGLPWAKDFYREVVYRPDDMTEIISYHLEHSKKIPAAMKKGFAMAFGKFDGYQLAKYRQADKKIKLVDIMNIVHPLPSEKNSEALTLLKEGTLKSTETWEAMLTKAGQEGKNPQEKAELKSKAWTNLLLEKKLGYFALLRNLSNILKDAPQALDIAFKQLTDEGAVKKSLVMPFRFFTAYRMLRQGGSTAEYRLAVQAIAKAADISLSNVPKLKGSTLVVLDESGSMRGRPAEIGAVFAATLAKGWNADLMTFSHAARMRNYDPTRSVMDIADNIAFSHGSTNFHSIFQALHVPYDRIVILSDMQGWVGYNTPKQAFSDYKKRTGSNPIVYSFDLNSYGTLQFPEQGVYMLSGFSEKVFEVMGMLEADRKAMITHIESTIHLYEPDKVK